MYTSGSASLQRLTHPTTCLVRLSPTTSLSSCGCTIVDLLDYRLTHLELLVLSKHEVYQSLFTVTQDFRDLICFNLFYFFLFKFLCVQINMDNPRQIDRPTRILIAGHSFVSKLNQLALNQRPNLDLDSSQFSLQFIARSGGKVASLRSDLGQYIPRNPELKPQLAYLEIGSNDLCDLITTPNILARNIYDLCRYLHYGHGVHRVIVGMILHRHARHHRYFDRQLSLSAYNTRVDDVNTELKSMAANNSSFISFWRHKGFTSPMTRTTFDAVDGVHPSRNIGLPKYASSVKHAIVYHQDKCSHSG